MTSRKPRDFQNARARRVLKEVYRLFKQDGGSLTVNDVADELGRTPRQMRGYLTHMHLVSGMLFIQSYEESAGVRGRKLPLYRLKRTGKEVDAIKWWIDEDISEGGHCD